MAEDTYFTCKPGCVWAGDPRAAHRVPVDCVTANELIDRLEWTKKELERLKAKCFDLMEGR